MFIRTVFSTSSVVICLSLREQEMLMCEYVITYHNVSFITAWCDVVYVFMCTRERERERESVMYFKYGNIF